LYALAFSLLLALGLGAYHASRTAALGHSDVAVIWEDGSQLRSGPGEDNTVLFKVNPGLEVKIIDHSGDWVQATASEHIAGWIEKKRLVLI
ncbi:MAG TPA: SH3 domain-containing protein, partial [Acidobacteriota bacterium]